MIVLDTHVWVWWLNSPKVLSGPALRAVEGAAKRHELFVSNISAWELALLVEKGRLALSIDVSCSIMTRGKKLRTQDPRP